MQIRQTSLVLVREKWLKLETNFPFSPFQWWQYAEIFSKHFCREKDLFILEIYEGDETLAIFPFEKQGQNLILLGMKKVSGDQEVTDYGNIISGSQQYGEMWDLVLSFCREKNFQSIILDYIREDSFLYSFFRKTNASIVKTETAPFILLPSTWEAYLESLERVNRKELKRKLKRLETVPYSFAVHESKNAELFNTFIHLHTVSSHQKEQFMNPLMTAFFKDVAFIDKGLWHSSIATLTIQDKIAAAILFFENTTQALLYNSGFDPAFKFYSNGLMLHALLIKRNIECGVKIHDFLRGNERYKYDFGARDLNLYRISINLSNILLQ